MNNLGIKDGAETKRLRYAKIAQTIQASLFQSKELGYLPLKKTIVGFKIEMGLSYEKIKEMLEDLQEIGQIELDWEKDQIRKPGVSECVC